MRLLTLCVLLLPTAALAGTHEVRMLSRGERGPMVYEPDLLAIAPGDTVRFVAAQPGHNAASIDGLAPAGFKGFKGGINEEIEITLTEPGIYGVRCSPHYAMGMVMLLAVGGADPKAAAIPDNVPKRAKARLAEIMGR